MQRTFLFGLLTVLILYSCTPQNEQNRTNAAADKARKDSTRMLPDRDSFGFITENVAVEDYTIQKNESLYVMLDKLDFSPREIFSVSRKAKHVVDLRSMRPGQTYRIYEADTDSTLSRLVWQQNAIEYVVFNWQGEKDSVEIYKASKPLFTQTEITSGVINNSLYQTISHEGGSPLLAQKMAKVFAWQVDFFSLRRGDQFKTIYEKQYVDGEYVGTGDILAAELKHRGTQFRAYYFSKGDVEGFYDEDGESVQRALLKAPFKYDQRISSPFSKNRMHPTLNYRRPHNGVDYAAPYGTPIMATGAGEVVEAQYRGANGNIVQVQHNKSYRTYYLHMKGFAKGVHRGARVEQGQVIGYVGTTGRSTGPHLHYEVRKHDKPINPLTMDLPSSESIPDSLMKEFKKVRETYDRQLKQQKLDDDAQQRGDDTIVT